MIVKDKTLLQKLLTNIKKAFRPVKADETQTGASATQQSVAQPVQQQVQQPVTRPAVQPVQQIPYEQLIAQARKEEKDKLYPQINELKASNQALIQKNNDLMLQVGTKEAKIQELTAQLETAQANVSDSEEVKTLKAEIETLKTENGTLKAEIEQGKLQSVKDEEIAKYKGAIIPELVTGTTKEEIAESAKKSNERFLELTGGVVPGAQQQQVAQPQVTQPQATQQNVAQPTVANPVAGGILGVQGGAISDDSIRSMSMEQYAQLRKQLGIGRR